MNKKLITIALSALLCGSALAATEQPTTVPGVVDYIVACGSSSGTYEALLDELQPFLADTVHFRKVTKDTKPISSSGAIDNLDLLVNNQIQGAFMHGDVPESRRRGGKDMGKFKTLLVLHLEEVHLLALATSHRTIKDRTSWNPMAKIPVVFNTLDDLAGYKVGAAGGGFITANVIKAITLVPYEIVQFPTGKDVINALDNGAVDCALFVGGAPLPNIRDLGPQYKLLGISDNRVQQLGQVYTKTSLTYPKMNPEAVQTVAADCLFMTQDYKTPKYRNANKAIRKRFQEVLEELKETPGDHPKWQEVDPNNIGKWPYLELEK
jgi:TRAP-type uncharacterized transport system substrate-binding protein